MKLYLMSQSENNEYDTYDSVVVAAMNEEEARNIHPGAGNSWDDDPWGGIWNAWCTSPDKVEVTYLGDAVEGTVKGVVLASFNAG